MHQHMLPLCPQHHKLPMPALWLLHLQETELLAAGFPCTDVSRAGARRGLNGEASHLPTSLLPQSLQKYRCLLSCRSESLSAGRAVLVHAQTGICGVCSAPAWCAMCSGCWRPPSGPIAASPGSSWRMYACPTHPAYLTQLLEDFAHTCHVVVWRMQCPQRVSARLLHGKERAVGCVRCMQCPEHIQSGFFKGKGKDGTTTCGRSRACWTELTGSRP